MQRPAYREIGAKSTMDFMFISKATLLLMLGITLAGICAAKQADTASSEGPQYTADGQLKLPEHYREWVWLTSDFYAGTDPAKMQAGAQFKFNNILVNPEAYRAFMQTGTWPDKTMLVVEQRQADDIGSTNPNLKGNVQSSEIGLAMHVKDEARFPGKWAFFGFKAATTASMIPTTAGCYSCHAAHGAADTTFVQYYPTLLPIAKSKNTLSAAHLPGSQSASPPTK